MRTVWRLCSARFADSAMSGEGARLYGGRWNRRGTSMVYCASTLSLGMLEVLVHASVLPRDYVAIQVDIPDGVAVETLAVGSLPANWVATPAPGCSRRSARAGWPRARRARSKCPRPSWRSRPTSC